MSKCGRRAVTWILLSTCVLASSIACGPGGAANVVRGDPVAGTKLAAACPRSDGRSEPYVVSWDGAERARFEALARQSGIVVVGYEGCELHVLSQCRAAAKYRYTPTERKVDRESIRTSDQLYSKLPFGAVQLEGTLARSGELVVDWMVVGTYEAEQAIREADLSGDCRGATHVVTGLTVGAFEFGTASSAAVGVGVSTPFGGGEGGSSSARNLLTKDGLTAACENASLQDEVPPGGCSALVRIALVPIPEALARSEQRANEDERQMEERRSSARGWRTLGYVLAGVGLAGGALSVAFGALGSAQNEKIESGGIPTSAGIEDAARTGQTYNGLTWGFGIGGGVLLSAGALFILLNPNPSSPPERRDASLETSRGARR